MCQYTIKGAEHKRVRPAPPGQPERGVGPATAGEVPRPGGVVSASAQEGGRGGGSRVAWGGCFKRTLVFGYSMHFGKADSSPS